jgi:hypothetical protein
LRVRRLSAAVVLSGALLIAQGRVKPAPSPGAVLINGTAKNVVHLLGLEGVKRNAKGELALHDQVLEFQTPGEHGPQRSQLKIAAIEDIYIGQESKQSGGKPLTVIKMAAPFGSGRVLSLFAHQKFDNLTLEYRDENHGFHGVVFLLAWGQAILVKQELLAQGAHASTPVTAEPAPQPSAKDKP